MNTQARYCSFSMLVLATAFALAAGASVYAQAPVGTAFTYQGSLEESGALVDGLTDFEFALWDDPTAGLQHGPTLTFLDVDVVRGLFTVELDFGDDPWVPNIALWLEIAVRYPAGSGSYTTLSPRQRLTPTPFSLNTRGMVVDSGGNIEFDGNVSTASKMLASAYASNSPWVAEAPAGTVRAYIDDTNGYFGIGTTSPLGRLHVAGLESGTPHDPNLTLENSADNTSSRGVSINFQHSNGKGAEIEARRPIGEDDGMSLSFRTQPVGGVPAERMRITEDGDVGIGSNSPGARLFVQGEDAEDALRVRVGSETKLLVSDNGGVAIGQNFTDIPPDGLRVDGDVGIGAMPTCALHVETAGNRAIHAHNTATSGFVHGVYSRNDSTSGTAIYGVAMADTGDAVAGRFMSNAGDGLNVWADAATGYTTGVYVDCASTSGKGVWAIAGASSGSTYGVYAESLSPSGKAVYGRADAISGTNYGVYGYTNSSSGYGVYSLGNYGGTGDKYFIQPHPNDPTKQIHFVCLEGNESGTYFRGSSQLEDGVAVITVPEEFRLVSEPDGLTVQVTATSPDSGLWVESKDLDRIVVRGDGNATFDYFVNGVRRGFADIQLIRENHAFVPQVRGEPFGTQYPDALRQVLVENGTLNPDFTPNEQTAQRLHWLLSDPVDDHLAQKQQR